MFEQQKQRSLCNAARECIAEMDQILAGHTWEPPEWRGLAQISAAVDADHPGKFRIQLTCLSGLYAGIFLCSFLVASIAEAGDILNQYLINRRSDIEEIVGRELAFDAFPSWVEKRIASDLQKWSLTAYDDAIAVLEASLLSSLPVLPQRDI